MENKHKQIINSLPESINDKKILPWIVTDNKFIRIFKIEKNKFWFWSKKVGRCFFCTDKVRKKQGNFCDRYCQGFYDHQESHRKLRMDILCSKERKEYNFVEGNLIDKVVKSIPGEVWRARKGRSSLYDIYTKEEWEEKPLNEQRLRIIRKIFSYMIKKREEFLYCFAPNCGKPFEVTPQTFSPFFCSKECIKRQQAMMKSKEWREKQERLEKENEEWKTKIKEIEEVNLLFKYGYSKEELPSFKKLFGGEITEEKLKEFFKLARIK